MANFDFRTPGNGASELPSSSPPLDIASLLASSARGDGGARDVLLEHLKEYIETTARRQLRGTLRTREQTGDVVQEVMSELYRRFDAVSTAAHLHNLIQRLIHNVLVDLYNKHTRQCRDVRRECELGTQHAEVMSSPNERSVTPPPIKAANAEDKHLLRLMMAGLRATDRELIVMRDLNGMSIVDIARHLGISEDAARMRYSRALSELARAWRRRIKDDR